MQVLAPHSQLAIAAPAGTGINSWSISTERGTDSGIAVSVSGAGAWGEITGTMQFSTRSLDKSSTYDHMVKSYGIDAGVSGFWSWLGIAANTSAHTQEIHDVFNEVSRLQEVTGKAHFDLEVSGQYPNVKVTAQAYVLILQVEDSSGNTYTMVSSGDPESDTGAQDHNGTDLPTKNNKSKVVTV